MRETTADSLILRQLREGRKVPGVAGLMLTNPAITSPTMDRQATRFDILARPYIDSEGHEIPYTIGPDSKDQKRNTLRQNIIPKLQLLNRNGQFLGLTRLQRDAIKTEYDRHHNEWVKQVHGHVVRRAIKAGYLMKDLTPGPNLAKYFIRSISDLALHDSGEHSVLGAAPSLVGEVVAEHLGKLLQMSRDVFHKGHTVYPLSNESGFGSEKVYDIKTAVKRQRDSKLSSGLYSAQTARTSHFEPEDIQATGRDADNIIAVSKSL